MTLHVDIATLDRHMRFLQDEQISLRKHHAEWADRKHTQLEEIAEDAARGSA
jgi:thermostable 8-oxoguanine DNA glycosylase